MARNDIPPKKLKERSTAKVIADVLANAPDSFQEHIHWPVCAIFASAVLAALLSAIGTLSSIGFFGYVGIAVFLGTFTLFIASLFFATKKIP